MTFDEYQQESRKTAVYPGQGKNVIYPTLGLVGEAGEVAEKVKRVIREHGGQVTPEVREQLIKELGDVLWYLAQLATELSVPLHDVADHNLKKLFDRQARGVLRGSGDAR